MSFLDRTSVVSYRCTCGELKPISRIYFCRHCFEFRCGFCVSQEIDTRHCTTCAESLPVTEAWLKRNCCCNCSTCPMCQSNLTTRATNVQKQKDGKSDESKGGKQEQPVKLYYMICLFCHWSTRDVNIPDAATARGWHELENPGSVRISELIEYYKVVAVQDRMHREKKLHGTRRSYTHISGMSAALARQKAGLTGNVGSPFRTPDSFHDTSSQMKVIGAVASAAEDDLPDDIYTVTPQLTNVTTLRQRLSLPETEPVDASKVCYIRKPLSVKRSLRCRVCEHNVSKPEYAPSSIKFKIQLSSYYLIPEIRIKTVEPLRAGGVSNLLIVVTNPTQHPTTVTLLPLDYSEPPRNTENAAIDPKGQGSGIPVRPLSVKLSATVDLPNAGILLPGRDDIAEFDEPGEQPSYNDDPKVVVLRKANKVVIKLQVHVEKDLDVGSQVLVGFSLRHIYTNTIIQLPKNELQEIPHVFNMVLNLGNVLGNA